MGAIQSKNGGYLFIVRIDLFYFRKTNERWKYFACAYNARYRSTVKSTLALAPAASLLFELISEIIEA